MDLDGAELVSERLDSDPPVDDVESGTKEKEKNFITVRDVKLVSVVLVLAGGAWLYFDAKFSGISRDIHANRTELEVLKERTSNMEKDIQRIDKRLDPKATPATYLWSFGEDR